MKINNNKGFTVVELMISFSLTMVVIVLLFQIVLSLKDMYTFSGVKTEILVKNSNLLHSIQNDLRSRSLGTISSCGYQCYQFTYLDGENIQLKTDLQNKTISYGNYTTKLVDGSVMDDMSVSVYTDDSVLESMNNSIVSIKIPIKNKLFPTENYDINIVFQNDTRSGFTLNI